MKKFITYKYNFFGEIIEVITDSSLSYDYLDNPWPSFQIKDNSFEPSTVIYLTRDRLIAPFKRKTSYGCQSFLFFAGPSRAITALFHQRPWRIYIQLLKDISREEFIDSSLLDLLLRIILLRQGLSPLHAACLSRGKKCILFHGRSGAGKTTTSLKLIKSGFNFMCDDRVFLKLLKDNVAACTNPKDIRFFLTDNSIRMFPELKFLKRQPYYKIKPSPKKIIDLATLKRLYGCQFINEAMITHIIFPKITSRKRTQLKPLSQMEILFRFLEKSVQPFKSMLRDDVAITNQMRIYQTLAEKCSGYVLEIGQDDANIPQLIQDIIN